MVTYEVHRDNFLSTLIAMNTDDFITCVSSKEPITQDYHQAWYSELRGWQFDNAVDSLLTLPHWFNYYRGNKEQMLIRIINDHLDAYVGSYKDIVSELETGKLTIDEVMRRNSQ